MLNRYFKVQRNKRKKEYSNFNLGKGFVLSFTLYYFGPNTNGKSPPWEIFQFRRSEEILGVYINGVDLLVKFKIG